MKKIGLTMLLAISFSLLAMHRTIILELALEADFPTD